MSETTSRAKPLLSNEPKRPPHRQVDQGIAGITAGATTVALLHPLDVIKTRLQVQDGTGSLPVAKGMVDMGRKLWASSGIRGLYAGLLPSMLGSGTAWGAYFYVYSKSKGRKSRGGKVLTDLDNLLSATEAGVVVSLATNPIWVVKTRLQLQDRRAFAQIAPKASPQMYNGSMDCFRRIVTEEGIGGLYRGLLPSLLLVSHGAIQLAVYERLKALAMNVPRRKADQKSQKHRIQITEAGVCGALSKAAATIVTYPSQVLRSRLQQRMDIRELKYTGLRDVLGSTLHREGIRGLYKGLAPNLIRVMPQSAVTFLVYETVLHAIENFHSTG